MMFLKHEPVDNGPRPFLVSHQRLSRREKVFADDSFLIAMATPSPSLRNRRSKKMEPETIDVSESKPLLATEEAHDALAGYQLEPLVERSWLMRLDVGPFLAVYTTMIVLDICLSGEEMKVWKFLFDVLFPVVLLLQLVLVLMQQWRVPVRARVGYHTTKSIERMTHCLVEAPHVDKHDAAHDDGIVKAERTGEVVVVRFRDVVFRCNTTANDVDATLWTPSETRTQDPSLRSFHRLTYPIRLPLEFYKSWSGHKTLSDLVDAQQTYGPNTTPIELPPFAELLQEQVVAPFFLFQVLCVLLWSLDEYWYYAMFTFFALLMFESTVAYNRRQSLLRLRSHTMTYQRPMYVYRPGYPPGENGWMQLLASELVPGDIVSCKHIVVSSGRRKTSHQQEQQWNRIPADILILAGDAVVDEALLTGESIPQLKGSLGETSGGRLDLQEHKECILFGGTTLLVGNQGKSATGIPPSPDQGVIGVVLRTGFETAQGSLLRTMAHTQKSVDGIHTRDTYAFILILLCCAIASAAMVLQEGWGDPTRNRFRLVLHVIIIVTSVVPPELPMELSLAVTNSVTALVRDCQVFCTEVFRIPLAGQVNICCFDKTGTLTSDEMQLVGIRHVDNNGVFVDTVRSTAALPWPITRIMAACHSLALNSNGGTKSMVGDPLEKAVLKDTGYELIQSNALRASEETSGRPSTLLILQRFRFSSKLKRMSVLVREDTNSTTWVLSKGAPETIKMMLDSKSLPSNYDEVSTEHMSSGQRVLAVAYRELTKDESSVPLKELKRDDVESNLKFAGFLLLDCPVKPDSKPVISELWSSGHSCCMITGDALLTAASVAKQVGIIKKQDSKYPAIYQLRCAAQNDETEASGGLEDFEFVQLQGNSDGDDSKFSHTKLSKASIKKAKKLVDAGSISLCVTGETLDKLCRSIVRNEMKAELLSLESKNEQQILFHPSAQYVLKDLVPNVAVFARHAPRQKEAVIAALNAAGYNTLMCGDGTNDVGALRRAHVGISLISAPEVEAKQRAAAATISKERSQQKKAKKEGKRRPKNRTLEESLQQLREAQEELEAVELGDASIASPFTSRTVSIKCCKDVLQQGRCTLVTMLQIYKILGVNCLVNATVLSKLFLHGVKNGDRQLTVLGLAVAALFFFVTRGNPLRTLSSTRPPSSVLCAQALLSIALQFLVHLATILLAAQAALAFVDPYDPSMIPDGPFNPNTLNSCTFLLSSIATVNTFAVNYRGEPFMESLSKNKLLNRSLKICYGILFACALEVFPPLNDLFQLTELPVLGDDDDSTLRTNLEGEGALQTFLYQCVRSMGFPGFISALMVIDTIFAFVVERTMLRLFEPANTTKKL